VDYQQSSFDMPGIVSVTGRSATLAFLSSRPNSFGPLKISLNRNGTCLQEGRDSDAPAALLPQDQNHLP
jgi:hypothetical protein